MDFQNKIKRILGKNRKLFLLSKNIKASFGKIRWLFPVLHNCYKTNMKTIGLDITSDCNLACFNCEASCAQAPSKEYMPLEQIAKFVDESIKLGWKWSNIKLRGGEPTLHPQYFDLLTILKEYKNRNPECAITLQTNRCGRRVKEILAKTPDWVRVSYVPREGLIYSSYNVAPVDLMSFFFYRHFTKGCWRSERCNMGLSRYGYYTCSSGANVDRVFGFNVGIKKLSELSNERFMEQRDKLCRVCGHFKEPNENIIKEKMSLSWIQAYEKYKKIKPKMSLY